MATCDNCGKEFNKRKDAQEFEDETCISYEKIKPCLCVECAINAFNSEDEGVFFEECVECGKTFDIFCDYAEYHWQSSQSEDLSLFSWWDKGPLCVECALAEESNTVFLDDDE